MIRSSFAHLHVAALSHPGMTGKNNEDRYAVSSFNPSTDDSRPIVFAVVSDGIGGHRAGEVAAELAVNYISQGVAESNGRKPLRIIENAIHDASQAIAAHSATKSEQEGMGATCACVWVAERKLYIAHVGDSRIYLIRKNQIRRLTEDHTWVQEAIRKGVISVEQARDHPNVHVIRRYLGSVHLPEVDFRLFLEDNEDDNEALENQGLDLEPGDVLLLCTDGLTDLVWDDEILHTLQAKPNLKDAADMLIETANQRGGHDNITVILLGVPLSGVNTQRRKSFLNWLLGEE
ncbi:MAG TPA: PP2C family serine/threonine-protein phosphatase [Anaerolineales bacterium]|nr:PP2C family serine/threonine-protein phosphatase [Anaerolineales bacterium]